MHKPSAFHRRASKLFVQHHMFTKSGTVHHDKLVYVKDGVQEVLLR